MPATSLFESAIYRRLGQSHLASKALNRICSSEDKSVPVSDRVHAICRLAYDEAQMGHYKSAFDMLSKARSQDKSLVKLEQRVEAFTVLVTLLQSLRA
jgi:hypothetical protein